MIAAKAEIVGNVWKILVRVGDQVGPGDPLVVLESMKMEMPVEVEDDAVRLAPCARRVTR